MGLLLGPSSCVKSLLTNMHSRVWNGKHMVVGGYWPCCAMWDSNGSCIKCRHNPPTTKKSPRKLMMIAWRPMVMMMTERKMGDLEMPSKMLYSSLMRRALISFATCQLMSERASE